MNTATLAHARFSSCRMPNSTIGSTIGVKEIKTEGQTIVDHDSG